MVAVFWEPNNLGMGKFRRLIAYTKNTHHIAHTIWTWIAMHSQLLNRIPQTADLQSLARSNMPMPKNPTKKDFVARLKELGEEAPEKWTVMELKIRITEIEEERGISKKDRNKTELQLWTRKLSMASRKKAELQAFCKAELGMSLTHNETIPQLQKGAMERIYQNAEAHETDPVGFGAHSSMTYQEVAEMKGDYAQWVMTTAREGQCCSRLMRLANWLEKNKSTMKETTRKGGPYPKNVEKETVKSTKPPLRQLPAQGAQPRWWVLWDRSWSRWRACKQRWRSSVDVNTRSPRRRTPRWSLGMPWASSHRRAHEVERSERRLYEHRCWAGRVKQPGW